MYLSVVTKRIAAMSPMVKFSIMLPRPFVLPPVVCEASTSAAPSKVLSLGGLVTSLIVPPIDPAPYRSLRSTQYLAAVEIEEVGVDDRAAVQRHCGRRQGRLIELEAYRRHGAAGGGQAAHLVLGLARTRRAQGDTGNGADQVLDRCDVLVGKIARAQGRHRDRRCLDGRLALFCGDDDLFQ